MAEWIRGLFSAAPDVGRANTIGLIVLGLGLVIAVFGAVRFRGEENRNRSLACRLIGLTVTAVGTLIAIYR